MSRFKACDTMLTEHELKKIDRLTGLHLDLCGVCNRASDSALGDEWVTFDSDDDIILDVGKIIQQEVLH